MNEKEYLEQKCSKCKNKDNDVDLCKIVTAIDGNVRCENELLEDKKVNKTIGNLIDELLENPKVVMAGCNQALIAAKKEAEKIEKKNEQLEKQIIEKDKVMEYLNGRIDGMEYIIEHLNLKVEEK